MTRSARIVWVGRVPLAFGLDWVPLLGASEAVQLRTRRRGVSHRVVSGDPPAALGLAGGLRAGQACWSAADLLARRHPRGTVACVLPLDADTWHVLAAHEGVALARADRSYPDPDLAREAVEALRRAHPKLELLAATDESGPAGLLQALARDWASALQAVLPAFAVLRLDAAQPLAVPAPRDAQGLELPLPEDFPALSVRVLRVEGPLRSGALLAPLAGAVSWRKAALTLAPGVRPDVRASRLILHLEGTVYEKRS